jgi:hypothetical protein
MTFVRLLVELAVAVWSVLAVPELAHAVPTITRPNANAAIRMMLSRGDETAKRVPWR